MSHRTEQVSNVIQKKAPTELTFDKISSNLILRNAEQRILPRKNNTKENFFRFGRFGLKKGIDVTYCGLESGTVFEGATGVCERICRFHSK